MTFQRFLTLTSPMAVTVMEARRQVAFQFDYLLDELPLGCQDHYLDRGRPVAEREQIHLDIQLRFHQMNDLKDFEISPNSRPLKFSLEFGTVHFDRDVNFVSPRKSSFKNLHPASYGSL